MPDGWRWHLKCRYNREWKWKKRGCCCISCTVNTLNMRAEKRWESLEIAKYPAGRAVSDVTSAHPCQVPGRWRAGSGTTKYLLMQRKKSVNLSFGLPMAFWGSILIIIFWNSSTFSRLFKINPPLVYVYWFSRERKGERETDKHQCVRENIDWLLPYVPQQDWTLNLVCALPGIEPQPFGVQDYAPSNWAICVQQLQKYRYIYFNSVLGFGWH